MTTLITRVLPGEKRHDDTIAEWVREFRVGDSAVDMKTAIAAGMFPLGVLWGFRSREELQDNGAQALIQRPQEIWAVLS